jgi:two-component system response regulator QseB
VLSDAYVVMDIGFSVTPAGSSALAADTPPFRSLDNYRVGWSHGNWQTFANGIRRFAVRILIVEDDARIAEPVAEDLRRQQHVVDVTSDGLVGFDYASAGSYDLMLLDIALPGLDGVSLCRKLRALDEQAMILMVTARDSIEDKVAALDAGADDYVVKPFDLAELGARVRAVGRRTRNPKPVLHHGLLWLEPSTARVTYAGKLIPLTRTEYAVLETLMRNTQQIFTRAMLQDKVTAFDNESGPESMKTHVANLRRKLSAAGCKDPVQTVYGSGYRLAQR